MICLCFERLETELALRPRSALLRYQGRSIDSALGVSRSHLNRLGANGWPFEDTASPAVTPSAFTANFPKVDALYLLFVAGSFRSRLISICSTLAALLLASMSFQQGQLFSGASSTVALDLEY